MFTIFINPCTLSRSTSCWSGPLVRRSTSLTASSSVPVKLAETLAMATAAVLWLFGWAWDNFFFSRVVFEIIGQDTDNCKLFNVILWHFGPAGQRWSVQPCRAHQLGNRLWKKVNEKNSYKTCHQITSDLGISYFALSFRNRPGVYTRISEYRTWIRNVLRSGWNFQQMPNLGVNFLLCLEVIDCDIDRMLFWKCCYC